MTPEKAQEIINRSYALPTLGLRAKFLTGHVASLKGDNPRKQTFAIRILEAALRDIQTRRLKRERAA
jgi:hypothetical protein